MSIIMPNAIPEILSLYIYHIFPDSKTNLGFSKVLETMGKLPGLVVNVKY